MEKDVLGVYVSGHPLEDYAERIREVSTITTELLDSEDDVDPKNDGRRVVLAGMIVSRRTMITRKNTMMAFLQIEDLYGVAEVIVFPNVYEKVQGETPGRRHRRRPGESSAQRGRSAENSGIRD